MLKLGSTYLKFGNDFILNWINKQLNPLDLPPYTIRLKYKDGITPTFTKGTGVQVSQEQNIWDLTYENSDWSYLLYIHDDLLEVLGANATGVTNMAHTFDLCSSLTSVPLFDTSNVTDMSGMFRYCTLLASVPLFDTINVTDINNMFSRNFNINCSII